MISQFDGNFNKQNYSPSLKHNKGEQWLFSYYARYPIGHKNQNFYAFVLPYC